jgi:SAM-dependent methyltransferase
VEVGGTAPHALGLAAHFARVVRVAPAEACGPAGRGGGVIEAAGGTALQMPFDGAAVDCVALRTPLERSQELARVLREARRILREGGCASFGFANRSWVGAARAGLSGAAPSVNHVRRETIAAGFRAVETFYVDPAFVAPATLLPRSRAAARFVEIHRPTMSRMRSVRRTLATLGLHRMLYPGYLCIAYA